MNFNVALGIFDVAAAMVTVWAMQVVTSDAGIDNARKKLSLLRRTVYAAVAIALFTKGAYRFEDYDFVPWFEMLAQSVIVGGFLFFPTMKAIQVKSNSRFFSNVPLVDGTPA